MRVVAACCLAGLALAAPAARAQESYESWPALRSSFPSTGGGGIIIKGYDPVITGGKCVTTFMAVEPGADPKVYPNFIEFEAEAVQGGTICQNGKWRAFDGGATIDPMLNLSLRNQGRDITAIVNITGPASKPLFAFTSIPRVGSSNKTTLGSTASHFDITTFC